MARPSTGFRPLDDLLGGLRVGDNVVWEAGEDTSLDPFIAAFIRASRRARGLVYVSVNVSPPEVLDRFGDVWEPERFLLVDCFTEGLGRGEETFRRFYRSRRAREVRVHKIATADPRAVQAELESIERDLGQGTSYVFDSLTGMQELWDPATALSVFHRSCPRLYDLRTVAYWLLERTAHDAAFLSRLTHVTQVVLDVAATDQGHAIKVVKAQGRPPQVSGRRASFLFEDGRVRISRVELPGTRERLGDVLRSSRIARGLSQAELARRIGISPSALSQAERGRAGLSVETLARALDALGSPFGPGQGDGSPSYRVTRRGARRISSLAPGLEAEELAGAPAGAEFFLLTFAPGASARRPPFATKRSEVLVVISGVLELRIGEGRESLQAGDAIILSSEPVGSWRCPGPDEARVLWTILP